MNDWKPNESLGGLIMDVGTAISKRGKENLRTAGLAHLSQGGMFVLALLQHRPQTQAEICKRMRQKPPSMMEMLRRLKSNKLVEWSGDENDARKINWSISKKGSLELARSKKVIQSGIGAQIDEFLIERGIHESKLEELKHLLHEMRTCFGTNKGD